MDLTELARVAAADCESSAAGSANSARLRLAIWTVDGGLACIASSCHAYCCCVCYWTPSHANAVDVWTMHMNAVAMHAVAVTTVATVVTTTVAAATAATAAMTAVTA